jgi:RNA polymerase sigma-70 factor (ECF subfamily)
MDVKTDIENEKKMSREESADSDLGHFRALIEQVRGGSEDAAWELVETYSGHIRAVVRRQLHPGLRSYLDSDDFVQSVWKSLFLTTPLLKKMDRSEDLVALLAQMSRHKIIDEVRKRTRTARHALPQHLREDAERATTISGTANGATPSQFAMARERWSKLVRHQSELVRRMIELRISGCNNLEIAAQMGINEKTVRRAMERLMDGKGT